MRGLLLIFLFLITQCCIGQSIDSLAVDTSKHYVLYPQRLFIGYFQSLQRYTLNVDPEIGKTDFHHDYSSGTRHVSGLEIGYDKLFFTLNLRATKNNIYRQGKNKTLNAGFALGSNKMIFEGIYQRHKGFYDANSPAYNAAYAAPKPYYQKPGITVDIVRFKTVYYTNHKKLAVKAHQGNNFRQLKTAISPVMTGGFFYSGIQSKEGIINPEIRWYFASQQELQKFQAGGLSVGGGLSATFVYFKSLYFGATGLAFIDPQLRRFTYLDGSRNETLNSPLSAEYRITTGYNSERLYSGIWLNNSHKIFNGEQIHLNTSLLSAGVSVAFRIKVVEEPALIRKLKSNKYYRML